MVLFASHILSVCLILIIARESFAYLGSTQVGKIHLPIAGRRMLLVQKYQPKFSATSSSKLFSSVMKPSDPAPIKPGPLKFIKRLFISTALILKINSLKVLSGMIGAMGAVQNALSNISSGGNKKDKVNSNKKKGGNKVLANLAAMAKQRKFWIQFGLSGVFFAIAKYLAFTKSLTTELSYTSFLKLISSAPERVAGLRVTPSAFMFRLDGKSALTRMVNLEPSVMDKLLSSGIDFAALPAPTNVLGLIWTFVYAAFIWNVSTKMMQGPQDEGAGKRKDKAGDLDAYGKLSFEDVAGQERAKLEVREVCEMLQAPDKFLSVGARLPSGVLLVGPPGTGE